MHNMLVTEMDIGYVMYVGEWALDIQVVCDQNNKNNIGLMTTVDNWECSLNVN